jgi:CRP/FNR family transcriptional regulator, cyclic AMP receptor protein
MRQVLFVLAELNDLDLDWIVATGARESIRRGQVLVRQGEPIESLYLILSGQFAVTTGDRVVNRIGQGELVGEISFLDSRPPTATVTAIEDSTVLSLPSSRLRSKLRTDTGFASRFYLALGVMLSHRLRDTLSQVATGPRRDLDDRTEQAGEFAPELLDKLNLAGMRFEELLAKVGPR